jgi:hypothetical protein
LKDIIDLLIGLSESQYGQQGSQVILTTHSPYLLDCVDVSKQQVLVAQRQENGLRTIEPVDQDRLNQFLDEFMLGEVWLNRGEAGLLKKAH